jgi:error-prone DNA polymerase
MRLIRDQLHDVGRAGLEKSAMDRWCASQATSLPQRPGNSEGFVFLSLEDETGIANVIITPAVFEAERLLLVHEPFLIIEGIAQKHEGVLHIRAQRIEPLVAEQLAAGASHDFR